ncbi:MAG: ATP-binding protein [Chloroflexi bacterium]|nr:ATP-binding protein [Chloroflexota bacterium]MBI3340630.1 ATP-binding protein [Chloroflexota bacterium]
MSLRKRLIVFVLLFGSAVLTNIFALVYLARSISVSLDAIENIRQRQLVAVQMNADLRDAEAALYRYQINGEIGFKSQFTEQLNNFVNDLEQYRSLAIEPNEQQWASTLEMAYQQTLTTGNELIELRDNQTSRLEEFLNAQSQLSIFLSNDVMPNRSEDPEYQTIVTEMQDSSRAMLSAVTGYLASPDETKRVQFTDAIVALQQAVNNFRGIAQSEDEKRWAGETLAIFNQLKELGTQLISGRDLQQSLYANFISIIFNAGQQTIVGQIEPYETEKFTQEQQALLTAVNTASVASILAAAVISGFAILFMFHLSRQINMRATALLDGAERVTHGNLEEPVAIIGEDEFGKLASSFNTMMLELANREDRLRAMIGRMAHIQDEERRLIGLDLHDGLTQLIISANMHLNTLNSQIGSRLNAQTLQALDVSRTLIKQSIDEARRVISELRPTMVEDLGLERGLRQYVTEVCEEQNWESEIVTDTQGLQIERSMEASIFRIAQEALTNARKHARTQRVRVELSVADQSLVLRVQDWGQGFDALLIQKDESQHLGLVSMQERAQMINGVCKIESQLGKGTSVEVRIPLASLAQRSEDGK